VQGEESGARIQEPGGVGLAIPRDWRGAALSRGSTIALQPPKDFGVDKRLPKTSPDLPCPIVFGERFFPGGWSDF